MPGYMMHLCEGTYIINKLNLSVDDNSGTCNDFLLGTIIPDAVSDKSLTHFRPQWQHDLITKYPDINSVIDAYPTNLMTAADLGIISHLMMDAAYVKDFWPKYFHFESLSDTETAIANDIHHVRMTQNSMQPNGCTIPFSEFFSSKFFYGDYDITNPLFFSDMHPYIPSLKSCDISIIPCRMYDHVKLAGDIANFTLHDEHTAALTTSVFPYADLKSFVIECADSFLNFLDQRSISILSPRS